MTPTPQSKNSRIQLILQGSFQEEEGLIAHLSLYQGLTKVQSRKLMCDIRRLNECSHR